MNFLLWILFLAGVAVKSDDSNNYYVIQMPEEEPHRTLTKAFRVFWNVPTKQCKSKGIPFDNLYERYGIIQNDNDSFRGEKVSILYDPGLFPALLKNESTGEYKFRNGGVPQEGDLEKHVEAFRSTLEQSVPDTNFSGIGIIDFESWRPIFRQNFGVLTPYKDVSYQIERKKHWIWPESWIKTEAKQRFEERARAFMQKTLSIAREMRPRAQWGYYGFPYCFNMAASNMRERCADRVPAENDEIYWLWLESTALYPSVYSPQSLTTQQLAQLVRGRLREAARVRKSGTPILPYFWFRYHSSNGGFLSETDLQTAIQTMYESEASGFILWGSSNDVNTVEKCKKLLQYVEKQLGPEVAKYAKYDRMQSMNDAGSDNDDISSSSTATNPTSSESYAAFDEFDNEKTVKPKNESDFEYYEEVDDSEYNKNKLRVVNPQFHSKHYWVRPQNHTRIIKKHFEDENKPKHYLSFIDLSDQVTTEALFDDLSQPPLIDTRKLTNDEDILSIQSTTEDGWNDDITISTDTKSYKQRNDDFEDTITTQSTNENKLVDVIPILVEIKSDRVDLNDNDSIDKTAIQSSTETEFMDSLTTSTETISNVNNVANVESIDIMDETETPINLNKIVDFESIDLMDDDFDTKHNLNTNKINEEKHDEFKMQDEIISKEYDPDENGSHSVHSNYEDDVLDRMRPIPNADTENEQKATIEVGVLDSVRPTPDVDKKNEQKATTPLVENISTVIVDNISTETNAPHESTNVVKLPATFDLVYSRNRYFAPKNVDLASSDDRDVQPMPYVKSNTNTIKLKSETENLSFIKKDQIFNDAIDNERTLLPNKTNYKQANVITNLYFSILTNDSYIIKANKFSLTTEKLLPNTTITSNLFMFQKQPLLVDHNDTNINQSFQPKTIESVNKHDENSTNLHENMTKLDVTTEEIAIATKLTTFSITSTNDTKDKEIITQNQSPNAFISKVDKNAKLIESVYRYHENRTNFDKSVTKLHITTEKVANATEFTTLSTISTNTDTKGQEIITKSQKPEVYVNGADKKVKLIESSNKHVGNSTNIKNEISNITTEVEHATELTTLSTTATNTDTRDQKVIIESQKSTDFISEVDKNVKPIEKLSKEDKSKINFDRNVTKFYITTEEIANATEITTLSTTSTKMDTKDQENTMVSQEPKFFISEVDKEEKPAVTTEGVDANTKYSRMDDFNVPIQNDQVPSSSSHSRVGGFWYRYCILFYFYSMSKCICDYYGQCS